MRRLQTALFLLVLGASPGWASAWGNVPLGTTIPLVTLPSTTGAKVTISAAGSKALVIIYVRPSHERSSQALADLQRLLAGYQGKGVKAIAVSTVRSEGEIAAVRALAQKLKLPFPLLLDTKEEFYGRFGVFVHPSTGIVDGKNVLRYEFSSHRQGYDITVERQLKAVLGLGPPPEKIEDLDRNAVPREELARRRQAKMKLVEERLELLRAQRRLTAAREILDAGSLTQVLKLAEAWAALLPLPEAAELAAAAQAVRGRAKVAEAVVTLRGLAAKKEHQPAARLWLGRALAQLGKTAEATTALGGCTKQPALRGQCELELARLRATSDPKAALALCKQGLDQALRDTD